MTELVHFFGSSNLSDFSRFSRFLLFKFARYILKFCICWRSNWLYSAVFGCTSASSGNF